MLYNPLAVNKSAAARLVGCKVRQVVAVERHGDDVVIVLANSTEIRPYADFVADFEQVRRDGAKDCIVVSRGEVARVRGAKGDVYRVQVSSGLCECDDAAAQTRYDLTPRCKHYYAAIALSPDLSAINRRGARDPRVTRVGGRLCFNGVGIE